MGKDSLKSILMANERYLLYICSDIPSSFLLLFRGLLDFRNSKKLLHIYNQIPKFAITHLSLDSWQKVENEAKLLFS